MSATDRATRSLNQLTSKQREVLALVADNRTSKEIAARLGISESAVNQRIEGVRLRLGGIPRGELARLFRHETEAQEPQNGRFGPTWQKIHLPLETASGEEPGVEGIPSALADGSPPGRTRGRDGSQLSAFVFGRNAAWLSREDRPTILARGAVILALLLAGMTFAAAVTQYVLPPAVAG